MQTPPPSELAARLIRANAAPVSVASAYAVQKIELRLSDDPALATRVIRLLPAALARDVTDDVLAHRELARLTPPRPLSAFRPGPAAAAAKLRAWYAEGERRSGVSWQVLAAVNFVESDFGRMRESSVAGAQGPMQFMPSTWVSYGRGDIHDPHAAILGAARFLRRPGRRPAAFRGRFLAGRRRLGRRRCQRARAGRALSLQPVLRVRRRGGALRRPDPPLRAGLRPVLRAAHRRSNAEGYRRLR